MALAASTAPTTAERIRSVCESAVGALLAVDHGQPVTTPVRHLFDDGSFAVTVPVDDALSTKIVSHGATGAHAVLELTDCAPLPLREPVRSLVWIRGRLRPVPLPAVHTLLDRVAAHHPNPVLLQVDSLASRPTGDEETRYALLRLQIESVVVADATGAEPVGVGALLAARPDPFCAIEACWLRHLDSAHPEVVARLASKLPARLRRGDVRPLGLDRYGVRLRVESADQDHDVRLRFHKPVNDVAGLNQAIRVLMGCPFANGLRARRF